MMLVCKPGLPKLRPRQKSCLSCYTGRLVLWQFFPLPVVVLLRCSRFPTRSSKIFPPSIRLVSKIPTIPIQIHWNSHLSLFFFHHPPVLASLHPQLPPFFNSLLFCLDVLMSLFRWLNELDRTWLSSPLKFSSFLHGWLVTPFIITHDPQNWDWERRPADQGTTTTSSQSHCISSPRPTMPRFWPLTVLSLAEAGPHALNHWSNFSVRRDYNGRGARRRECGRWDQNNLDKILDVEFSLISAAALLPAIPHFRLSTFGMGPWEAASPSTVNNLPPTPSPFSTRTPTPTSPTLPQSHLCEFQMPADEERTIKFKIGPRQFLNGGKRHHFAVRQPFSEEEGENPQPGRLRRLVRWIKTTLARARGLGR